ncbi:MAG: UDP-N-acetylmuramate dehydrogenase [Mariprofundales bacterium]|nr:UDP-N-acetylmuramate dehydrogenase [Mariprofundales bacterium]
MGRRMGWQQGMAEFGLWREQEAISGHVTLGAGGRARWFFRPHSQESLVAAMQYLPASVVVMPLGRGSNLLVTDGGFDGLMIDMGSLDEMSADGDLLRCGAGVRMSAVAARCAELGLSGLEFMATVPGSVGGAVAMNAGAFGQQVSDSLVMVELLLRDGSLRSVAADELSLGYRCSDLPAGALMLSAQLHLQRAEGEAVRRRMREMRSRRAGSQPLSQPNCGSVFKNPPGEHAARLIEAAGLKGRRIGGAEISAQHANFIVNLGGASASDVLELIALVRSEVNRSFAIDLQPELRVVGR